MIEFAVEPISSDYQVASLETSFDWEEILRAYPRTNFVLFAFRAKFKENANMQLIEELDNDANEAAKKFGLLYYFKGKPNINGDCLSWCLWPELEQAERAAATDEHRSAAAIAKNNYKPFNVEVYFLRKAFDGIRFERILDRPSHH